MRALAQPLADFAAAYFEHTMHAVQHEYEALMANGDPDTKASDDKFEERQRANNAFVLADRTAAEVEALLDTRVQLVAEGRGEVVR